MVTESKPIFEFQRIQDTLRRSGAFKILCKKCDERILGGLFTLLVHSPVVTLDGRQIDLRPMDSSTATTEVPRSMRRTDPGRQTAEYAKDENKATDKMYGPRSFAKRQIGTLVTKTAKLSAEIQALNRTPLARAVLGGLANPAELQALPLILDSYAYAFIPLLLENRKRVGAHQHPDSDRLLKKICEYVRIRHGTFHDPLVAKVLGKLNFHESNTDKPYNAGSLKQWRYNHGLTDATESKPL